MSKPTHVAVYSPAGEKVLETPLNAIDLVRSCGYTYQPGKTYSPTDSQPYANVAPPAGNPAQDVLDRNGHRSGVEENPAARYAPEPAVVFDAGASVAPNAPLVAAPAPLAAAPAPVAPPVPAPAAAPAAEPAPAVEAPAAPAPADEPQAPAAPAAPAERQKRPSTKGK